MIEENVQRSTSNDQRSKAEKARKMFEEFVVPSYSRFDLVLERGEGSYVWDVDGKRYLDAAAGLWCASLGYASERLARVAYEQMRKLGYYHLYRGTTGENAVDLAEKRVDAPKLILLHIAKKRMIMALGTLHLCAQEQTCGPRSDGHHLETALA